MPADHAPGGLRPSLRRRAAFILLPGFLATSALAVILSWCFWPKEVRAPAGGQDLSSPASPRPPPAVAGRREPSPTSDVPLDVPGISRPPALPAAQAELDDDELVVGVSAGGRSRAYTVRALSRGPLYHIVNDVLSDVPVSVTHCDLYDCTRAFTGGAPGQPLDLSLGGLSGGSMVLKSKGRSYRQDSGAPLDPEGPARSHRDYPCEQTTWGEWRGAHPDTDVYVSEEAPGLAQTRPPAAMRIGFPALAALAPLLVIAALPLLIAAGGLLIGPLRHAASCLKPATDHG